MVVRGLSGVGLLLSALAVGLAVGGPAAAAPPSPVLVIMAHPDDETLGAAGVIESALVAGRPVYVAVVTNGSGAGWAGSSSSSVCGAATGVPSGVALLGLTRERESEAAMTYLGGGTNVGTGSIPWTNSLVSTHVFFLGYPDGGGTTNEGIAGISQGLSVSDDAGIGTYADSGDSSNQTCNGDYHYLRFGTHATLTQANLQGDISDLINHLQPGDIYTHAVFDGHPDHAAVARDVLQAVQTLGLTTTVHATLIHHLEQAGCLAASAWFWPNPEQVSDPTARATPDQPFLAPPLFAGAPSSHCPASTSDTPVGNDWGPWGAPNEIDPVPADMALADLSQNHKWQAISKYQTQLGSCPANVASCGYLYAFIKSDEFFWSYSFGAAAKPAPLSWPTISGTGHAVGNTLTPNHATAADGTWANTPTSYTDQWVRCDPVGELTSCTDIAGATGLDPHPYILQNADAGTTLRLKLTATNPNGSTTIWSDPTDVITGGSGSPPTNTLAPAISGSLVQGQLLSVSNGSWSGSPAPSFSYQWQRCDGGGANCAAIAGATGQSYTLVAADVGHTLVATVTATNTAGSSSASSAPTAAVTATPSPPVNTVAPLVSGSLVQGQLLSVSNGSWSGSPAPSFSYQWQRCDGGGANCAAIAGATGQSYTLVAADVGHTLVATVTATNTAGFAAASSAPSGLVNTSASSGGGGASSGSGGGGGGGSGVADLRLEGTVDPVQAGVGDTLTWRITVNDYNTGPATNLWVDITLPANVELTSSYTDRGTGCVATGATTLHCYLDWLADSVQFGHVILVTKITATGDHVLTAVTGYSAPDPHPADNSLTLTATTPAPVAPAPAVPTPTIRIVQTTAAKSGIVTVKVAIKGWTLAKQLKHSAASSGYWAILVDSKRNAISRLATTGTTTKLAPGRHQIRAELLGATGKPLSPPVQSNTVAVHVPAIKPAKKPKHKP